MSLNTAVSNSKETLFMGSHGMNWYYHSRTNEKDLWPHQNRCHRLGEKCKDIREYKTESYNENCISGARTIEMKCQLNTK